MRYTHQMQRGVKVEWSRVWLDGPTIIFTGLAGFAVHEYFGVPEVVGYICASLLSYLGEKGVTLILEFLQKRAGK